MTNRRIMAIDDRLDEIMDELDSLSHASEWEQQEALIGEYKDLEAELQDLLKGGHNE